MTLPNSSPAGDAILAVRRFAIPAGYVLAGGLVAFNVDALPWVVASWMSASTSGLAPPARVGAPGVAAALDGQHTWRINGQQRRGPIRVASNDMEYRAAAR